MGTSGGLPVYDMQAFVLLSPGSNLEGIKIDGEGAPISDDDGIYQYTGVEAGSRDTASIKDCVITQFHYGIYNYDAAIDVDKCNIENCYYGIYIPYGLVNCDDTHFANNLYGCMSDDDYVPQVYSDQGLIYLDNCTFLENGNPTTFVGGPIWSSASVLEINRCWFGNNTSSYVFDVNPSDLDEYLEGTISISDCDFVGNVSNDGSGGGALYGVDRSFSIKNCRFASNEAQSAGGAIKLVNVSGDILRCWFDDNYTFHPTSGDVGVGGALRLNNCDAMNIARCVFSNNAADRGGALSSLNSSSSILNCTFMQNQGVVSSALQLLGSTFDISNSIFWNQVYDTSYSYYPDYSAVINFDGASALTLNNIAITDEHANLIGWEDNEWENPYLIGPGDISIDSDLTYMTELTSSPFGSDSSGDYHLSATSACLDRLGAIELEEIAVEDIDNEGNGPEDNFDGNWDLGADERQVVAGTSAIYPDQIMYDGTVADSYANIYFENAKWGEGSDDPGSNPVVDIVGLHRIATNEGTYDQSVPILEWSDDDTVVLETKNGNYADGYVSLLIDLTNDFLYGGRYVAHLIDGTDLSNLKAESIEFYIQSVPPSPDPTIESYSFTAQAGLMVTSTVSAAATSSEGSYPVQYRFTPVSPYRGLSSGWADENSYTFADAEPGTVYVYQVQARFKEAPEELTALSTAQAVLTTPQIEVVQVVNGKALLEFVAPDAALAFDPTTDPTVEYEFTGSNGFSRTWSNEAFAVDESPATDTTYTVRFRMTDPVGGTTVLTSDASATASASDVTWSTTDDRTPRPDPQRWLEEPTISTDLTEITMEVPAASDYQVSYYFECTTDSTYDSGWQTSPSYTTTGTLAADSKYAFRVRASDSSDPATDPTNVTEWSEAFAVWTDVTPPTTSTDDFSLTVIYSNIIGVLDVDTDIDAFWIARVPSTGITSDSDVIKGRGWQEVDGSSTYVTWVDYTRADGGVTYYYSYKVRDEAGNETNWSSPISATTVVDDRYPEPNPMTWDSVAPIQYEGITCAIIAAQEATLPGTLGAALEYRFTCSDTVFSSDWQDSPIYEVRGLQPATTYSFTVEARRGEYAYHDYVTGASSALSITTLSGEQTTSSIVQDVDLGIWYDDLYIALFEAASGHTLELEPGTYPLTDPIVFAYSSGITLRSRYLEDPTNVASTILDASGCVPIVVFEGDSFEDNLQSTLEGLTISGADDSSVNGVVYANSFSRGVLKNCVLTNNTTANGGAVYGFNSSELELIGCVLSDNTAEGLESVDGFGGAIYGSTVSLKDCELYDNQASRVGGAVYASDLTMRRCSVHDNEAIDRGGAIYSSHSDLQYCQIYNNSSSQKGGGLCSSGTSSSEPALLTNCVFKNNTATHGGGFYGSGNPGAAEISGCVFIGNSSSEEGGGIYMSGALVLTNCTVLNNQTASTGLADGVYQGNAGLTLINCIFTDTVNDSPFYSASCTPAIYSCLIQGASLSGDYVTLNSATIGRLYDDCLLNTDPLFVGVDDYHLKYDLDNSEISPCIDAGFDSANMPLTDIDNELRTFNGTVDIGADEWVAVDEIAPSPVGWEVAPVAVDCNTATMTALTANDASGPVTYCFTCDNGTSSGLQTEATYTLPGLTAEATYGFSLQVSDAAGNFSESTAYSYVTLPAETASFVASNLTGGGSYETIQAALDEASNGDVIEIQPGTHDEALDLDGLDITLQGTDPCDPSVIAATILTNSSDGPVLTFPMGSNCEVKGLTIADSSNLTGSGGGVYASNSQLTFQQCRIVNCQSSGDGGGLYGYQCDINLWNCVFMDNSATGSGGGAYCYPYNFNDDEVHVVGCVFYQNSATSGGGFCCDGGYVWGLGWCTYSTFVDNTASSDSGAIYGVKYIDNSIFWGNRSPDVGDYHIGGSAPYMTGGLIEGAHESSTAIKASDNSTIGNKNGGVFVFDDPEFIDGYHLSSASCAIDIGTYSEGLLLMDIDGEPRFVADLDLGADEFYRSGVPVGYRFGSTVESIANNTDDVGQKTTHYVNAYSQYLVMGLDDTYEMVGLRFTDVNIPNGSAIYSAYLEFSCDDPNSEDCSLTIVGEDSDDAVAFSGSRYDVSSRTATTASVSWDVEDWDTSGAIYASVDISSVIEEIVQRPGWSEGNALVLMISGTGQRYAESLEGGYATTLHIVRYLEMQ